MVWRLPTVLAAMAVVLAAGVLSIRHLESHVGATSVRGVVLVALPRLDDPTAWRLAARWEGASATWVTGGEGAFAPFRTEAVATAKARGEATVLLHLRDPAAPAAPAAQATQATQATPTAPATPARADSASPWLVRIEGEPSALLASAADFLAAQHGARPFSLALDLSGAPPAAVAADDVGPPLIAALETLPSFRRTTLVMLGPPDPAGRRAALRIDRGRRGGLVYPELVDLLWTDP